MKKRYFVFGTLTDSKGQPLPDLLVQAFDQDPNSPDDFIGSTISNEHGYYEIAYTREQIESPHESGGADLVIKVYSVQGIELAVTDRHPNAGQREQIDISDIENLDGEFPLYGEYQIEGKVVDTRGVGIGGLIVQAFDQFLPNSPKSQLAVGSPTRSDKHGNFRFIIPEADLQTAGKRRPDLIVKAMNTSGVALQTVTIYDAGPEESVTLVVSPRMYQAPTELENLTNSMRGFLNHGLQIKDVDENAREQGISYLSRKTGTDARLVAMNVLAHRYVDEVEANLPEGLFYSLFRAGVSSKQSDLYRVRADEAVKLYQTAVEAKVVPDLKLNSDELEAAFRAESAEYLLTSKSRLSFSPLGEMLSLHLKSKKDQQSFVDLYFHGEKDPGKIWSLVEERFGTDTTAALRLDGKLGYLTLNNAPLVNTLRRAKVVQNDPLDLIRNGLYQEEAWEEWIEAEQVPDWMQGETAEEKASSYKKWMSGQLRWSYPTAVVAERIQANEIDLQLNKRVKGEVYTALYSQANGFELGQQSINRHIDFLEENQTGLSDESKQVLKRIHRAYQLSPSDQDMMVLLDRGLDSAFRITSYSQEKFVSRFGESFEGGEQKAIQIYHKASSDSALISNTSMAYLTQKVNPLPWFITGKTSPEPPEGIKVNPTLEELFGSLDFCTCGHCESVLSPAAYYVDLLQFIDLAGMDFDGDNPIQRLLARRPDLEHIELTCENTNTVLPYIDLVNEILCYYVIHPDPHDPSVEIEHSLEGFEGYNIATGTDSADLLAQPAHVNVLADEKLKQEVFPIAAPFHRQLALSRAYFGQLDAPLSHNMEVLRSNERLDSSDGLYGWREILREEIGLSPQAYRILTDHEAHDIAALYGQADGTDLNLAFTDAKAFCRNLDLSYADCQALLRSQFINPRQGLLTRLELLQTVFVRAQEDDPTIATQFGGKTLFRVIRDFLDADTSTVGLLNQIFPLSPEEATQFGESLDTWFQENEEMLMNLIFLVPTGGEAACDFEQLRLQYAHPDEPELRVYAYLKIIRFLRLKAHMGWTVQETDETLQSLLDPSLYDPTDQDPASLDNAFADALLKLALMLRVADQLRISPRREWHHLLALWGDINNTLYHQLFLRAGLAPIHSAFEANGLGEFLNDPSLRLIDHRQTLQAAFKINDTDWENIWEVMGADANTPLSMIHVRALFRYSFLARKLRISLSEFLDVQYFTGLAPTGIQVYRTGVNGFGTPDLLRFIQLVQAIKDSSFKIKDLNYLLRHLDPDQQSGPRQSEVHGMLRTLRTGMQAIEATYNLSEELDSDALRALLVRVYGESLTNLLYATLEDRPDLRFEVDYTHSSTTLGSDITSVDSKLGYHDLSKRLSYIGVMRADARDALLAISGISAAFQAAITALYDLGQARLAEVFSLYPEIQALYDDSQSFTEVLRDNLVPILRRLKQNAILEILQGSLDVDLALLDLILEGAMSEADRYVLSSAQSSEQAAIHDFLQVESQGVSVETYYGASIAGSPDVIENVISNIRYDGVSQLLPENPTAGDPVSIRGQFFLEIPASGFFNFYVDADPTAAVNLWIGEDNAQMNLTDGLWRNQAALELSGGQLYEMRLEVENVQERAQLSWQTQGTLIEAIPQVNLYPAAVLEAFADSYIRLLKVLRLAEELALSTKELHYFSEREDFEFGGDTAFLNLLPVREESDPTIAPALFSRWQQLIRYRDITDRLSLPADALIDFWQTPMATNEEGDLIWYSLVPWSQTDFQGLAPRIIGLTDETDLSDLDLLDRLISAAELLTHTGASATHLLSWTDPDPSQHIVDELKQGIRSRYEEAAWLELIQPLHDQVRRQHRDALVQYVLFVLSQTPSTAHIDTSNKLFEYFLIDVEMDPCMKTSRIKQAISSVQLFVHRCLMNLELGVDSSSIDVAQWDWMKRYRVWEANRKVFLYPENWLDPSLRTTKTPIFKELEGELFQSDLNDDLATQAILNYLEKLDRIAQLQISGICREDAERIHVIGHSSGASREYYHRRYDGTWSAWESISQDIEGEPVIPVFWKGRLFLLWLSVLTRGKEEGQMSGKSSTNLSSFNGAAQREVDVSLCWTEYYNGKWQTRKTSDMEAPLTIETSPGPNRSKFSLTYYIDEEEALHIGIQYGEAFMGTFTMYNKHGLPERKAASKVTSGKKEEDRNPPEFCAYVDAWRSESSGFYRAISAGDSGLKADFHLPYETGISHQVLGNQMRVAVDFPHPITNIFAEPFFTSDFRHVFFVELEKSLVRIPRFEYFGVEQNLFLPERVNLDDLWIQPDLEDPGYIDPIPVDVLVYSGIGVALPPVTELAQTHIWRTSTSFTFNDLQIGVQGMIV